MKKYLLLLVLPFLFLNNVNAVVDTGTTFIFPIENTLQDKPDLATMNYIYNTLIPQYNSYSDYIISNPPFSSNMYLYMFNVSNSDTSNYWESSGVVEIDYHISSSYTSCSISSSSTSSCNTYSDSTVDILRVRAPSSSEHYNSYYYYDSSFSLTSLANFEMTGFYSDNITVSEGSSLPKLKDLYNYNSYSDYENDHLENYTTVNLDDYEYVLLSLKNYNQSQPFQTNLQVKGQIGITPIYNYGQTSKDSITGVQVQDRCNLSYSDYTSYPFYIIQSDLNNNAIFAVKSCSNGSSFKFDSTIFDITYVTQSNLNDPTITINGTTYHTIPYADLPSSATVNEENNYIPGQSGSATDTGGLDSAIKNVQQKMSEIWDTFTYFTDFIGQLFSVLPVELKTILLSAFTIAIILGLIKIFIN